MIMENGREDHEIEDMSMSMSMSPPSVGSMQIAGSNGFGHSIEFMSQAYLPNSYSEVVLKIVDSSINQDPPLPIHLKPNRFQQPFKENGDKGGHTTSGTRKYKKILKGITGSIGPGEILALMGPSGSGKTTLLKVIGGRLLENVKGNITYNDVRFNPAIKRRIGFVTQEDVLFPQLTIEETLIFSAFLRLPTNMSKQQKYAKVENTIKELGLERCRHTKIGGGFLKGISGGERKRTSIGYEILVDPSLLLLDEPTSGLDSTSANKLLLTLQGLAKGGRTIITTIHQPSSRIFHMFDKLLLISEGYPVYYGKARDSMEYFSSLRFAPEIPMNPAEFLLDLATGQVNDISVPQEILGDQESSEPSKAVIKYLKLKYKEILDPKEKLENHGVVNTPKHLQLAIQVKKEWTLSWLDQFIILYKRTFTARCKDYFDKLRLIQALGIAIILGLLWWKSSTNTEAQLRDQIGLMFYICIFWTSSCIFGAVYVFHLKKPT
ncbi:ABC transporter G family member [Arachis hypogaea]|nr:ABC transporter G family member [Arachis hypogaea]